MIFLQHGGISFIVFYCFDMSIEGFCLVVVLSSLQFGAHFWLTCDTKQCRCCVFNLDQKKISIGSDIKIDASCCSSSVVLSGRGFFSINYYFSLIMTLYQQSNFLPKPFLKDAAVKFWSTFKLMY